ncbi:D-3-phosphoglycerate dehydrogenase, partial [Candidatus Magnetomorum sp. HK-1]
MNTILITTSSFAQYDKTPIEMIQKEGYSYVLNEYKRKLSENEVLSLIEKYEPIGLIAGVEPLTSCVLEKAKYLKVISRCGIGMDNIDLKAAKKHSVHIVNTPDAPTVSVAELTLGLILNVLRKISFTQENIKKNNWLRPMGNVIHGKTIGIIGCGRIGTYLGKLLSNFNCMVLGFDIEKKQNKYYLSVEIDELYEKSDIITLHIPYSKKNHHLINRNTLSSMKKGAVLINTARGALVDEDALYEMLISSHLSGAALDCFENEPYSGKLI